MTSKFGNLVFLLFCAFAVSVCTKTDSAEIDQESTRIRSEVCSQTTLEETEKTLEALEIDYFLSSDGRQLTAIKRYNEEQVVSSAIALTIDINSNKVVTDCKVEIIHTGL